MASCWSGTDGCIYSSGQMVIKPWCCWTSHCIYSSGQNVNKWIWTFKLNLTFYLEGHSPSAPKLIGISTTVFCIYCPNVVVLAWTVMNFHVDKLGVDTHTRTNIKPVFADIHVYRIPEKILDPWSHLTHTREPIFYTLLNVISITLKKISVNPDDFFFPK